MKAGQERNAQESQFGLFHSVRNKLLALMIGLSLLPLMGMSVFSYFIGGGEIQERITLSLGKMAQDTADKIDFMLRGQEKEILSMATTIPLIYSGLREADRPSMANLLNKIVFTMMNTISWSFWTRPAGWLGSTREIAIRCLCREKAG